MYVDLSFSLNGTNPIAADHGYALYGAISRILEDRVHADNGVGVHPIRGRQVGNRQMMLTQWSRLTLRVADDQIASMLRLAGKALRLGDASVRVGVPTVHSLIPGTALRSRLVVIKVANVRPDSVTADQFAEAARRQLGELGVSDQAIVTIGKRRTLRVKEREIVGYEVVVEGLMAEESMNLQSHDGIKLASGDGWKIAPCGLGGKRHMGCGVFVPSRKDE
jgi:CRISPR-associated protein Cas6